MSDRQELDDLLAKAAEKYRNMTDNDRAEMDAAQKASFALGMGPCEHGVLDFETCPECRGRHDTPTPDLTAPERLYTNKNGTAIITPPAIPLHETDIEWLPAARLAELEAENARLRGALSIYADVVSDYASDSELASDPAYDWLHDDAGSVARAALDKG